MLGSGIDSRRFPDGGQYSIDVRTRPASNNSQQASSDPLAVSTQNVNDSRARLENRYFEDDVVWVGLHDEWHPGSVIQVLHAVDPFNGPFNTQHDPHNLGLNTRVCLQESFKRDDPWCYLYRVFLFDQNVAQEPIGVYAHHLSRDLPSLVKVILECLPAPSSQLSDVHSTSAPEPPTSSPGASSTSINIFVRQPNNVNTSTGTFVYNDGPGNIQSNSGAGRFYDLMCPDISGQDIFQNPWSDITVAYAYLHLVLNSICTLCNALLTPATVFDDLEI
ncbi:hypothetical protein HGRIS_001549 [Hohenbuehelia grisea]|uniref:Uncharacterized protein n=1 Tax=Hohenbuehelia grisea TaxID=104357 RepID=A0ABR3JQM0_9AGAR